MCVCVCGVENGAQNPQTGKMCTGRKQVNAIRRPDEAHLISLSAVLLNWKVKKQNRHTYRQKKTLVGIEFMPVCCAVSDFSSLPFYTGLAENALCAERNSKSPAPPPLPSPWFDNG